MAAPTIPKGEEHFFPIIYEGNGGGQKVGKFVPFTDQATIANSCIFNRADNPYMYFNKSGITPDSDKKFTFSCWFKIGEQGSRLNTGLFNSNTDGSNGGNVTRYAPLATFTADGNIFGYDYDSGGYNWYFQTNRTFEDTSKWYHFVLAIDTTQSTSTDRMKVYIDGDQITSFSSSTYPALNQDLYTVMAGGYHILGLGYNAKFDGYIAEVNLIENQQLTPASFGITDTSTGRWIPKTVEPFPTTTTDIAVTVVSSGGNKYALDGVTQGTVTLIEGATYKFDQSDSSNATHPLRFSTTSDGTHNSGTEYTTGVTTVGTPGSSGAYTQITVATGAPTLYYYCSSHSGMGGTANTQDQYGTNGFRLQFLDSTHAGIDTSGNGNTFTASNLIDFESQPIAMGGTAFDTGSAGAWDGSYPVANGFTESTSTQAIYNDGSTAVGGVIGWDFGSGRSANIQHIKINQLAVNNSITGFTFEYSDNGSDYTSVGTFSVTAATSTQTVSVLNTAGKHRYWRLKSTTNTTGGQSSYRWVVAFLGFFSEPITTDSPTQNFPTVNISGPYIGSQQSAAQGNLKIVMTAGAGYPTVRVHKEIPQSGKWYWEVKAEKVGNIVGIQNAPYGVLDLNLIDANQLTVGNPFTRHIGGMGVEMYSGAIFTGLLTSAGKSATDFTIGSTSMGDNDYIVFAFDMDNGKAWWGWNDSSAGSSVVWFANDGGTDGNPSTGANPTVTFNPRDHRFVPAQGGFAPGSSDGAGGTYASNFIYNFGSKAFAFTAPTGFSALSQNNFPETDKGVSGLNWIKDRDNASYYHTLQDSSRGPNKELYSNDTAQQASTTDSVTKFLKGGVAVEDAVNVNNSGDSFVSWNWVCNGGTTETNTDGDTIVTLQKNTTAGFSIGTFTSKVAEQTCGHGLGVKPDFILLKRLDGAQNWMAYHSALSSSDAYYLHLNNTDTTQTGSDFGNDVPTSTVFHTNVTGTAGRSYCFWAWNSVEGYSKFGKYEGNNSADGTFVYLGFKPAFVMIKGIDSSSSSYPWAIYDNRRSPTNPVSLFLEANSTAVENNLDRIDFLSNGFKLRQAYSYSNAGETYVYVAFAEHPFVGDGTSPVTAR